MKWTSPLLAALVMMASAMAQDVPPASAILDGDNPLGDLAGRCLQIEKGLEEQGAAASVRDQQKAVVLHLDELIERLRKKQRGPG